MAWMLWMIAGAVLAALALVTYVAVANWVDERARSRHYEVLKQQRAAEATMQQVIENSIAKMFEATRSHFR